MLPSGDVVYLKVKLSESFRKKTILTTKPGSAPDDGPEPGVH
jgi:hypothetical protein